MQKVKDSFFLIIGLALIAGSLFFSFKTFFTPESESLVLQIGDALINVEVARTKDARTQGLSGRESLPEGSGMLFIFDDADKYGIWMKDMSFSIDIVWIDEDSRVTGIERDVSPETFPNIFYPPGPIKYALELPAGDSLKFGIDTGDLVYLR